MANTQDKFKKELDFIRKDYNRAKRLLANLEVFGIADFAEEFKKWRKELMNDENGVTAILDKVQESKILIEESSLKSSDLVSKIKENLDSVKENIDSMQESYERFLETKGKIESVETNIENLSDSSKELKNDIDNLKNQSQSVLDSIKDLFGKAQEQIVNMQSAYQDFLDIKSKIEDEKTGLSAIFNYVQGLHKKSQKLHGEIQGYRDESNKLFSQIKDTKEATDKVHADIQETFKKSKEITDKKIEEIQKITSLITDTGFANSFHKQAKRLDISRYIWLFLIVLITIGLSSFLYLLFVSFDTETNKRVLMSLSTGDVLYRISLTSPLVFLLGFSVRQYGRESKLNDKYQFKADTATSISHHIEFLQKNFPNNNEIIISFAQDTFSKIYKEPYEDGNEKIKNLEKKSDNLIIEEKNKNKDKDFNINDVIKSSKELKDLFIDESLLKDVLKFFNNLTK